MKIGGNAFMTSFSIKDLAELSGVKQHTIRIWEQRYSFLHPKRTSASHRTYTVEELNVLLNVALLNQNGYKISHIDKMTLEDKVQVVATIVQQQQKIVHELIIQMAKMNAKEFDKVLNHGIHAWGIHEAIQHILLPFCEKVGLLFKGYNKNYLENIIVIKQIIKQKLLLGIENAVALNTRDKKALFFLPAGEQQELPLLYLQYLLKMQGFETLYLGQHVSIESLEMIIRHTKQDYIITMLVKRISRPLLVSFVEKLPKLFGRSSFISIENHLPLEKQKHYKYAPTLFNAYELILEENK